MANILFMGYMLTGQTTPLLTATNLFPHKPESEFPPLNQSNITHQIADKVKQGLTAAELKTDSI